VENNKFGQLVAGLSLDERHRLLSNLIDQSSMSSDPLYHEEHGDKAYRNTMEQYTALPWYSRLWIIIQSFFKGRSQLDIFEDQTIVELGRHIDEISPGLYDYEKGILLPLFYSNLERLKDAARFFFNALETGVYRDKGTFYAFLGSLEMTPLHKKLQEGTNPLILEEKNPYLPLLDLKKISCQIMEEVFMEITDDYRKAMYFNARSLLCLRQLSSFLFDRLLLNFSLDTSLKGKVCSAGAVKDQLLSLNNVLLSLKAIPPMPLLQSLFIFLLHEKAGEHDLDIEAEIHKLLKKAENALMIIREFNRVTPLTKIIRCASRNMTVEPHEISGGEDWFVDYRDYWKNHIETIYAAHIKSHRYKEIVNVFRDFLKNNSPEDLENTVSESNPDGIPLRGSFSLSFLRTFYSVVFLADLNLILRPILTDGEFELKENRLYYNESYNEFIKLENDIHRLEEKVSESGDYGKRYTLAKHEITALTIKRRKVQIVVEEASAEAEAIITAIRRASRNMIDILKGIIGKDGNGSKYGTLSNLDKFMIKIPDFLEGLNDSINKFGTVIQILDNIDSMEMGA
jgi:hypothetical protein